MVCDEGGEIAKGPGNYDTQHNSNHISKIISTRKCSSCLPNASPPAVALTSYAGGGFRVFLANGAGKTRGFSRLAWLTLIQINADICIFHACCSSITARSDWHGKRRTQRALHLRGPQPALP